MGFFSVPMKGCEKCDFQYGKMSFNNKTLSLVKYMYVAIKRERERIKRERERERRMKFLSGQ